MEKCRKCKKLVTKYRRNTSTWKGKLYVYIDCLGCDAINRSQRISHYHEVKKTERYKELAKKRAKKKIENNPEKYKARYLVRNAIVAGKLKKPTRCSVCKKQGRIHGHHPDYSKPLEVVWLCDQCHRQIHS